MHAIDFDGSPLRVNDPIFQNAVLTVNLPLDDAATPRIFYLSTCNECEIKGLTF